MAGRGRAGAMSAPIRQPASPMAGMMASAASPVPVDTSRIRLPGCTPAAVITNGTNSRNSWPGPDEWTNAKSYYRVRIKDIWFDVEDTQMVRTDGGPNPTGNAILV